MEKEKWNLFIRENSDGGLLQSWEWGEFQTSLGRKVIRISKKNDFIANLIKYPLLFNKFYLYCPRGPILERSKFKNQKLDLSSFIEEIKSIAKKENVIFFRFDPPFSSDYQFENLKLIKTKPFQPQQTLILDLSKSEEELLKDMHQKTRYNIKLAQKKGVKIREGSEKDTEIFWTLIQKAAKRNGFKTHPKIYYQKLIEVLGKKNLVKLFIAQIKERPIAAILVAFFNKKGYYLHGGSDYQYRNLMAPYLLQWHAILEAKRRNLKFYDFWGVDPKKWPGLTRFKAGFAPKTKSISYLGTYDIPFNWLYYGYKIARFIKHLF